MMTDDNFRFAALLFGGYGHGFLAVVGRACQATKVDDGRMVTTVGVSGYGNGYAFEVANIQESLLVLDGGDDAAVRTDDAVVVTNVRRQKIYNYKFWTWFARVPNLSWGLGLHGSLWANVVWIRTLVF
ncbi:hypothetical protein ACLB2K_055598 [Fragaria x ananassa]